MEELRVGETQKRCEYGARCASGRGPQQSESERRETIDCSWRRACSKDQALRPVARYYVYQGSVSRPHAGPAQANTRCPPMTLLERKAGSGTQLSPARREAKARRRSRDGEQARLAIFGEFGRVLSLPDSFCRTCCPPRSRPLSQPRGRSHSSLEFPHSLSSRAS